MPERESQKYLDLYKELDDIYLEGWRETFMDVRNYILPRRGKFLDVAGPDTPKSNQKNRHQNILVGAASRYLRFGAAGIHGHLTSPARPWFRLVPPNLSMLKIVGVRQWLQAVETLLYNIYSKTNFYQCVHSIYQEEMGFGTGVLLQEEDPDKAVRFYVMTAGEYRLATNAFGAVDTVGRVFYMTVRQLVQRFGKDVLSKTVQDLLKLDKFNESIKVLQVVRPNSDREQDKIDSANLPCESIYCEYDTNEQPMLEKKGFNENPFTCPRWDVTANEAYGGAPAHDLAGEIKTLQVMRKDVLAALHKTLDPPMRVPTTYKDTLNRLPGGVNFVDVQSEDAIKPLYQINFDIQSTKKDMQEILQDIREGFYNDLFLMLSASPGIQPKNEMEIMELQEEKLIMLGPVIERQFQELLNPVIARTFAIAWRNGLVPPPPPELNGADVKVEYVSFLAQAQKKIGIQAINSAVSFAANLSSVFPEAADKINVDEAIDAYSEIVGAPQQIIRGKDDVAQIRKVRQEKQKMDEAAQQAAMLGDAAKGVKQLSGADTSGKNALTDILKQAGVAGNA